MVHNGIIENSNSLKKKLEKEGYKFKSQTDTEVITLLITKYLKDSNPIDAVLKSLEFLEGSFALGILFKDQSLSDLITKLRQIDAAPHAAKDSYNSAIEKYAEELSIESFQIALHTAYPKLN